MAWETGTAIGHSALLNLVHDFLVKLNWKIERFVAGKELIASQTPNNDAEQYYYIGFKTVESVNDDWFNWKIRTGNEYFGNVTFENMPNSSPIKYIHLWQHDISYYFIGDSRHVKVVAQVSSTTRCCYLGKINQFASIAHWPKQTACCGESDKQSARWSDNPADNYSNFQFVRGGAAHQIQWVDNTFIPIQNLYPNMNRQLSAFAASPGTYSDGSRPLLPIMVMHNTHKSMGEYIGAFFTTNENSGTMQVVTLPDKSRSFLMVQNVFRNGFNDFMALELV
ncbi:hypothetical protein [Photobacterium sanguinicancri]|uniref:Uncharacterized protein n=1 Tax=Photobacterium sanguinicancri TaxID=875932 RepID=A0AAW7Y749_9GAMM|nr:hypothetical protein [Photobacterium sanguinicancri]MDO6542822.1 hypothetical protein [Photobacterium sanguinicancri]